MQTAEFVTLPFFFRHLDNRNSYILTNQAGAFTFLENANVLKNVIHGNWSSLSSNTLDELLAKNFISEANEFDARKILIGSRFASVLKNNITEPSLFIVIPTLRCHHDCHYCQVSRVPINKKGFDLSRSNITHILGIIGSTKSSSIKIEFQGGEPLLSKEFIQNFVQESKRRLSEKEVSFVICTSLTDINDSFLSWAKVNDITFSVSLDGHEMLHNLNRPSSLFNTYKIATRNIQTLFDSIGKDSVSCLTTITKDSFSYVDEIIKTYIDMGLNSIFLRPLSPFGFSYLKMDSLSYTAYEYFEFYKHALDKIIALNENLYFVEETALIHLNKIFRPFHSGYVDLRSPAGYALGALVFNYDGNIFGSDEARMLYRITHNEELVIGKIGADESFFNHETTHKLLSDSFISCTPGCDDCAYQPYCGADPLHHLSTQGDHVGNKANSFFCKLETLIYDHLFDLYNNDTRTREVFDKWLSR